MTSGFQLVRLRNGACTLRSLAHRETFHPVIGPVAEAEALFVRQLGLLQRVRQPGPEFVVWDVGLGAAANALTVLQAARDSTRPLRLVSFDCTLEPLRFALAHTEALEYLRGHEEVLEELMAKRAVAIAESTRPARWELHLADFPTFIQGTGAGRRATEDDRLNATSNSNRPSPIAHRPSGSSNTKADVPNPPILPPPHLILWDPYSPAQNPAMWTQPLFSSLFHRLSPERPCALATYSRSTMLRVALLLAGFYVGRGHATGEKEETTIAANSLSLIAKPLEAAWLRRARNSTSAEPLWEPRYRQAPLAPETWERLRQHPQFRR